MHSHWTRLPVSLGVMLNQEIAMTIDATRAERLEMTAALVTRLKAIETGAFEILHEGEIGCIEDNGCDVYDLERVFAIEAYRFQSKISAYRQERARLLAYIADENNQPHRDRDDEHRTHHGTI